MATPITRAFRLQILQSIRHTCQLLFGKYLLPTNVGLSICLSGSGDILQQHYDIIRGEMMSWDKKRTGNMSISGATVGAVCHFWYLWLDKKYPGRTLRTVLKKVVVDQVIFSPVYISVFFLTMGILEKSAPSRIRQEIYEKGRQLYFAEWIIWPPAQMINFLFLPTRFRVLYDNTISLGFDVYTSYLKNKVELKNVDDEDKKKQDSDCS